MTYKKLGGNKVSTEITKKSETNLGALAQGISNLVAAVKEENELAIAYAEANKDFGLTRFDNIIYLSKDNRGRIIDKQDDGDKVLGENAKVIVVNGGELFQLWPEAEARPLVKASTKEEVISYLYKGQDEGDERFLAASETDIQSNYVLDLILLDDKDIDTLKKGGTFETPKLRRLNLTISSKIQFNNYAAGLFRGKFAGFQKLTTPAIS